VNQADILTALGWACFAGGGAAIGVYLLHFLRRQGWRRPWNAAGLLFTAIALTQVPLYLVSGAAGASFPAGVISVVCLLVGVGIQSVMALRTRRGGDRRGGPEQRRA
jgi:peptidoglycan/LPS O-acetylase OafA/YrhL